MNSNIRFTVLIPTYNRERFIRETIDSVLAQDFPTEHMEIIVVNDGSTDRTDEVLGSYGARIRVLYHSNQGGEVTRHFGASFARGEYIILLDDDDLMFPWALSLYDHIISSFESPPLIISQVVNFHDGEPVLESPPDNDSIEVYRCKDYLSREISVGQTCSRIVIKRSVAAHTGFFRPKTTAWPFDITDMLLLAGVCSPCIIVNRPYSVAYRIHQSNTVNRIDYMVRSFPRLLQLDRSGSYPGGMLRRFDRQALIGAMGWSWVRIALKHRKIGLAIWLLLQCGLAMAMAILRKFRQRLTTKITVITLGDLRSIKSDRTG